MDAVLRNIRYASRRLLQNPGFTLTAIISLALGIGANIAIFSLVNAILLKESPLENPEEVVMIYTSTPRRTYGQSAYPDFEDLRDLTRDVYSSVTASAPGIYQVDLDGAIKMTLGEVVSGDHFSMLGIRAHLGRTFTNEDDVKPGAHPVVMLSYGFWERHFAKDPGVIGQDLRIAGRPCTIVGVAPLEYKGNLRSIEPEFYVPIMMYDVLQPDTRTILKARDSHRFFVRGRIEPGVTLTQAQVALDRVSERFRIDYEWGPKSGFLQVPQSDVIIHPPIDRFIRASAWLLTGVVGLVLLIACTNLAGFLLARSLDRRKEIAVRLAMGARRKTLLGQFLTETVLLSILGGIAGVGVASGFLYVLTEADLPLPVPVNLDLGIDPTVLCFSLLISVLAGILLGLIPALQSTHLDIAQTLQDESAGSGFSRHRLSLRNALVMAQVAVCLVLLIGAGLFLRSLLNAQSIDPGFGKEPTALLSLALSTERYSEDQGRIFMTRLLDEIERIPGVRAAGVTHNLHLNKLSSETMAVQIDGIESSEKRQGYEIDKAYVDPGFFDAVGISILQGRNFDITDTKDSNPVAIISEAMAKRFWPGETAIGRRIHRENEKDLLIAGIARDAKVRDLSEDPRPFIYLPYSQNYAVFMEIIAKTEIDADQTALRIVETARGLDPDLYLWAPTTMERHLGFVLLPFRLSALVLSGFAVLGLALASMGLWGIVSYSVSQRTREVGIRMSLGADLRNVILMLMASGMKLVVVGCAVGLVLALILSETLSGLLFGIDSLDVATFLLAPVILLSVAAFAAFIAACRASRISPVIALKSE